MDSKGQNTFGYTVDRLKFADVPPRANDVQVHAALN